MRYCSNCEFNDGFIYPTMPPKYKCTITDQYHFGNFDCNLEFVPVVRCKECIHYKNENHLIGEPVDPPYGFCGTINRYIPETFYCAYGERREDV